MAPSSCTEPVLPGPLRETLLHVAEQAIVAGLHALGDDVRADDFPEPLRLPRATFVTLERGGELRGCIGTLVATRPLVVDVAHNARAAAFDDPRFAPLEERELAGLEVKLSILNPPQPLCVSCEDELLALLRPGVDGLILCEGWRRATFLPAVWESLPDPRAFLHHLRLKAGLPAGYWSPSLRIDRYTTESFGTRLSRTEPGRRESTR